MFTIVFSFRFLTPFNRVSIVNSIAFQSRSIFALTRLKRQSIEKNLC